MNILLSVKHNFVEKIMAGQKRYEFRRTIFKKDVNQVLVYSTAPTSQILLAFEIEKILTGSPSNIWKQCHRYAGLLENEFFDYFKDTDKSFAIKIGKIHRFKKPLNPYLVIRNFRPPQSFYYTSIASPVT